jgi:hypothetical protein
MMEAKGTKENKSRIQAANSLEHWSSSHFIELINCPYQPGNLKISKSCCLKRYAASQKIDSAIFNQSTLFYYTIWQGFLKCKTCSVIKGFDAYSADQKALKKNTVPTGALTGNKAGKMTVRMGKEKCF